MLRSPLRTRRRDFYGVDGERIPATKREELVNHTIAPGPPKESHHTRLVSYVDRYVGKMIEKLEAPGHAEDSTLFEGEVFQIGGSNMPQSINGGDATPLVSTDGLQVIAPVQRLEVLGVVNLGGRVLTPNGDGVHDELAVSFTLQGIEAAAVDVSIYDLGGRLVRRLGPTPSGRYGRNRGR